MSHPHSDTNTAVSSDTSLPAGAAQTYERSKGPKDGLATETSAHQIAIPPPPPEWKYAKYFLGASKKQIPLKGKRLGWAVNTIAGVAILFYGFDQGVMSGVNNTHNYLQLMGLDSSPQTSRDSAAVGGIVAVYYAGTLVGALIGGSLGDRIGRLKTIFFACIWATLGAALQASAQNITWMCCARVITGIGTGQLNCVVPVWVSECSHHSARGAALGFEFFLNIAGLSVAYWIEFALRDSNQSMRWRLPLALQIVFLVILFGVMPFFPESPRWLAKVGREEEANRILNDLRADDPAAEAAVEEEMRGIMEVVEVERSADNKTTYCDMLFKDDSYHLRRRTWLVIWLQIMQELVGIGVVTVYAPTVFQQAGYSTYKADLLSGINDLSYMMSVLVAVFTLDRLGRRVTLLWGAVGMGIALIMTGVAARYATDESMSFATRNSWGAVVTTFTFVYTALFGATWLTVPWLYPTETMPLHVRAKGGAWSVVGWSIGNGVVTEIAPFLFNAIGYWTFILFALLNFFTLPNVWLLYPETAGRSLEEMDILFAADSIFVYKAQRQMEELKKNDIESYQAATRGGMNRAPTREKMARPTMVEKVE